MWDEISLQPQLQYDTINDKIVGFEDWGHKRTQRIADHALVFMLRGIRTGWKIPLSYNFCKSQTKSGQLIYCIKKIVKKVVQSGFTIIATVCDQATSNVSAINELLNHTRGMCLRNDEEFDGTIILYNQKIIHLYDPPHLIKGIRNNFLTKDIEIDIKSSTERKFASWDIIETAYHLDIFNNTLNRQLKKLTDEHIIRSKIKKMKVKLATQVFSGTLSAFIEYNSRIQGFVEMNVGPLQIPQKEGFATAQVLDFFNKLFDSVNGLQLQSDILLRVTVKKNHSKQTSFFLV
ncbi:uncharacterized protein LOC105185088 [Harpegnathos saltator]|uniref:uncharacterized protein LOC105185088 n=1 Tax=Harpegnathos saltator TaxID=610380 RepID=UPI000DBEF0C1|nr:uncharacterized protein LOC105185088 [Harpegnathos saltator]